MDTNRFDFVSKYIAQRRLSRQGIKATAEQGAKQDGPAMLFVQSFTGGRIAPKAGAKGRYTLNLDAGAGQTIYFADGADPLAGATPTDHFLGNLDFPDDNPPSAALVVKNAAGEDAVAVVDLFSPVYDEASGAISYEIEEKANGAAGLATLDPSFGAASLFIEGIFDCPDHDLVCYTDPTQNPYRSSVGVIANADHDGYCVDRPSALCYPCKSPAAGGSWQDECNRRYTACNGNCNVWPRCTSIFTRTCDGWPT